MYIFGTNQSCGEFDSNSKLSCPPSLPVYVLPFRILCVFRNSISACNTHETSFLIAFRCVVRWQRAIFLMVPFFFFAYSSFIGTTLPWCFNLPFWQIDQFFNSFVSACDHAFVGRLRDQ